METTAVKYNDLVREPEDKKGVTVATGATYTAGMLLVSDAGADFAHSAVALSTAAGYNTQEIGVLLEDVDATGGAEETVVALGGKFNRANVFIKSGQVEADINGVLQAKNILLEDWSK